MQARHLALIALFVAALPAHSQQPPQPQRPSQEILGVVGQGQAQRLEEYNQTFLQEELYSATRHRIVSVNANLLLQNEPITITPFPDVKPIVITPEKVTRTDTGATWLGRIQIDPALETAGAELYAPLNMLWWDLDDSGNAELSASNRFKFSPAWRIDENDQPVQVPQGIGRPTEVGPPPRTREEIAEHKRLQQLQRRAFGSLSTRLELPSGEIYVVAPLKYAPRYAVVYEVDNNKFVSLPFEAEDAASQTPQQRAKVQQYQEFVRRIPVENKPIRGDIK